MFEEMMIEMSENILGPYWLLLLGWPIENEISDEIKSITKTILNKFKLPDSLFEITFCIIQYWMSGELE